MKTKQIIEAIGEAYSFAQSLEGIAGIAIKPGKPEDIAAVALTARRLSEELASIQRMIGREVDHMKALRAETATRGHQDVMELLLTAEAVN